MCPAREDIPKLNNNHLSLNQHYPAVHRAAIEHSCKNRNKNKKQKNKKTPKIEHQSIRNERGGGHIGYDKVFSPQYNARYYLYLLFIL